MSMAWAKAGAPPASLGQPADWAAIPHRAPSPKECGGSNIALQRAVRILDPCGPLHSRAADRPHVGLVAGFKPAPLVFHFDLAQVHSTVLGLFREDNLLATPALLHFPCQGSMRLTSSVPDLGLTYQSNRPQHTAMLSLPGATFEHQRVVYTLDVTAIYPEVPGIADDRASTRFAATG